MKRAPYAYPISDIARCRACPRSGTPDTEKVGDTNVMSWAAFLAVGESTVRAHCSSLPPVLPPSLPYSLPPVALQAFFGSLHPVPIEIVVVLPVLWLQRSTHCKTGRSSQEKRQSAFLHKQAAVRVLNSNCNCDGRGGAGAGGIRGAARQPEAGAVPP